MYPTSGKQVAQEGVVSGECVKTNPAPAWQCNDKNLCVAVIDGLDLDAAKKLASEADSALVAIGTTSCEGYDRESLSFAQNAGVGCQLQPLGQDNLVSVIAAAAPTIVAMVAPGAVLTPWRGDAKAIIHSFMPGQEYGNALADIIFGKVNPTARMPLTMPNVENEIGFTPATYPGIDLQANYSERMLIDYRWYTSKKVTPAFAFGTSCPFSSYLLFLSFQF